ncbi:MAG: dienelactone hydrolase family protein [Dehalococcoidia bacterium]
MNAYQKYLIEEFVDEYHERHMSRRDLLRRAVLVMGSVPAAATALIAAGCGGDDDDADEATPSAAATTATQAATTAAASPSASATASAAASPSAAASASATLPAGVTATDVRFKGPASDLLGYLTVPAGNAKVPGILVIHENRGLNEHTKDVARRFAAEGISALAVDLVSREGGSKADTATNTGALGRARPEDFIADLKAYGAYLLEQPRTKAGGIGVVGYCFGGGYTFEAAIADPNVKAAVPYYGICRLIDQLATTKAAVLVMYGANDNRVTSQAEQVGAQLARTNQPYDVKIYPNANHAFFNDTGNNYNADAAKDAWTLTLDWFRKYV